MTVLISRTRWPGHGSGDKSPAFHRGSIASITGQVMLGFVLYKMALGQVCSEYFGLPVNYRPTHCFQFITHHIIRRYIASILTASLNNQLRRKRSGNHSNISYQSCYNNNNNNNNNIIIIIIIIIILCNLAVIYFMSSYVLVLILKLASELISCTYINKN
jgi:hypothetical protein